MIFLLVLLALTGLCKAEEYGRDKCKISSDIVFHSGDGTAKDLICGKVGLTCLEDIYNSGLHRDTAFAAISTCSIASFDTSNFRNPFPNEIKAVKYLATLDPVWFQSENGVLCKLFSNFDFSAFTLEDNFLTQMTFDCYKNCSSYDKLLSPIHPLDDMPISSILKIKDDTFRKITKFWNKLDPVKNNVALKKQLCEKLTSLSHLPLSLLDHLTYDNCVKYLKNSAGITSPSEALKNVDHERLEKIDSTIWAKIHENNIQDNIDLKSFSDFATGSNETTKTRVCNNIKLSDIRWELIPILPGECLVKIKVDGNWNLFVNMRKEVFDESHSQLCQFFVGIDTLKNIVQAYPGTITYSDISTACLAKLQKPLNPDSVHVTDIVDSNEYDNILPRLTFKNTHPASIHLFKKTNASKFCGKLASLEQLLPLLQNSSLKASFLNPLNGGKECLWSIPDLKSKLVDVAPKLFGNTKEGFLEYINGDEARNCSRIPHLYFISEEQSEGLTKSCYDLIINRFEPKDDNRFWGRILAYSKTALGWIHDDLISGYENKITSDHADKFCQTQTNLNTLKDFLLKKVSYEGCIKGKSLAGMSAANIMKITGIELGMIKLTEFESIDQSAYDDLVGSYKAAFCGSFRESSEVTTSTKYNIRTACSGAFRASSYDKSTAEFTASQCKPETSDSIFDSTGKLKEALDAVSCLRVKTKCVKGLADYQISKNITIGNKALKELKICKKQFDSKMFSEYRRLLFAVFGTRPADLDEFIGGDPATQCAKLSLDNLDPAQLVKVSLACVKAIPDPFGRVESKDTPHPIGDIEDQSIIDYLDSKVTATNALIFCKDYNVLKLKSVFQHFTYDNCLKENDVLFANLTVDDFLLLKKEEVAKLTGREIQKLKTNTYEGIFKGAQKEAYCGLFYADSDLEYKPGNDHPIKEDCKGHFSDFKGKSVEDVESFLKKNNKKITDPSIYDEEVLKNLVKSDKECKYFAAIAIFPESLFDSKLKKDCVLAIDETTRWNGITEKIFAKLSPDLFKEDDVINLELLNVLDDSVVAGMTLKQFEAIPMPNFTGKSTAQLSSLRKSHICFRLSDSSISFKAEVRASVSEKCSEAKWTAASDANRLKVSLVSLTLIALLFI